MFSTTDQTLGPDLQDRIVTNHFLSSVDLHQTFFHKINKFVANQNSKFVSAKDSK